MTHFLVTDENPDGYRLEDDRPEARHVLENNIKILGILAECISLAEDSTTVLDKSFGKHKDGEPRIGVA
jgi:hypothetical protein